MKEQKQNAGKQGVDKMPGEKEQSKPILTDQEQKGKKVDGDPSLESGQPMQQGNQKQQLGSDIDDEDTDPTLTEKDLEENNLSLEEADQVEWDPASEPEKDLDETDEDA